MDVYVVTDLVDGEVVVAGAFKDEKKAEQLREKLVRECADGYSDERFKTMSIDELAEVFVVDVEIHTTELTE